MTELEIRAGEELERQLARYARVRLEPGQAQAKRARAAVMEAAWRRRLAGPDADSRAAAAMTGSAAASGSAAPARAAAAASGSVGRRRGLFAGWSPGRVGGALAAAVLAGLLVGSTAFATSRAGGPLYEARISFEELTLPADPASRLEARLAQAQSRLAEIVEAVSRDDAGALVAAVHAYDESVDVLSESTGAAADRVLAAIEFHQAILLEVQARAPEAAQAGLANALANSGTVVLKLDAAGATPATSPATNGSSGGYGDGGVNGGAGVGGGQGSGGQGGKPSRDPAAAATAKPGRTQPAEPLATKQPKPTPAPDENSDVGPHDSQP